MPKGRKKPNYDIRIPNQPMSGCWGRNKHATDRSTAAEDENIRIDGFRKRNNNKPKKLK